MVKRFLTTSEVLALLMKATLITLGPFVSVSFCQPQIDGDRLSPQQAIERLTVADGMQVRTFAADPDIVSISNIDVDHRGRVWACECVNYRGNNGKRPEGDRILIMEDRDGDGAADATTVFYQGRDIDIAMGLCVLGNKAIVAASPNILLLEDTDGDDRADKKTVLFTSDAEFQHDHSLHSFVFGPDGRFYGNFGNTGHNLKHANGRPIVDRAGNTIVDDGKPYHGGMVFRCDRDFANFEVLGHNFRNNYEVTVDSFGGVWQSDNDDDGNLAVRLNYILAGGNYGYLDELTGERWRKSRIGEHPFRGKRHWHQNDPGAVPNVIETGNGAPTGVTVYEGDLLPEAMQDQVIFCDAGPHVVWALAVEEVSAGFRANKIDILRSPDNNFRPIDAAVAPDGSLFVSDWYDPVIGGFQQNDIERGRIYWIAPMGHQYADPEYDLDSAVGVVNALRSPNYCARYLAWLRLHELGAKAEQPLATMSSDQNPRMRARALWLLGQIPGKENTYIRRAIGDENPDVRIVGIRLADLIGNDTLGWIKQLAADPSARVRAECAVLLRNDKSAPAAELWARLAMKHDGTDRWYLESLGIGADGKWDACMQAFKELDVEPAQETRNDLVWRSRGKQTPDSLAQIILAAANNEDVRRYIRAFDFQTGDGKQEALLSIVYGTPVRKEIALAAADRVSPAAIIDNERWRARLNELLSRTETSGTETSTTSLRLIQNYHLTDQYPQLLELALREEGDLGVNAITALLDLDQQALVNRVLKGTDAAKALTIGRVLAQSQHAGAMALLLPFLQDENLDAVARKETARTFSRSDYGGSELLKLVENNELSQELRDAITGPLLTHKNQTLRERAEKEFPTAVAKNSQPMPKLAELVELTGNAAAGQTIFFDKQAQCANCHQVNGKGKAVGPDLSQIGTKLARPALFEAILYPSAAISHNFESHSCLLENGQVTTGILTNQSEQEIQLLDAEGILRTLDRLDVESIKRQTVSLMPANLHESISTQQLVDLVDYLATLRTAKTE